MPDFSVDDIYIEPYEYVSACGPGDIKELIKELIDEGHIKEDSVITDTKKSKPNTDDSIFEDSLNKLYANRLNLTLDEENMINKLAERFKFL